MKRKLKNIMVTGGAGFIGSNFIQYLFNNGFDGILVNVDSLTYAGNPENLTEIEKQHGEKNYFFKKCDIQDYKNIKDIFQQYDIDAVIHFAAESHVDRSIYGPKEFIFTNIIGTFNLLEIARELWKERDDVLFHHISTDEVFGSLGEKGYFTEETRYSPNSPYSASKAASDHLVRAYYKTYGLPCTISNCSNNYGPFQFPEKMIPLMICNALEGKPMPVYGDGLNVRDWLYVEDHCEAISLIMHKGQDGQTYNIGGENEWKNIDLVNFLCEILSSLTEINIEEYKKLITFIKDRPGHDRRYAIDCKKIKKVLGWSPGHTFETGIEQTIKWYMNNQKWVENIKSGSYKEWIRKHYK
ncbi:MAG: dTDP-glucose 4,6-dehydratase [Spirochaetes bacterium]|nr:dTDP-glucose 4,6-dehydratase [Spirochaetota bacterium]